MKKNWILLNCLVMLAFAKAYTQPSTRNAISFKKSETEIGQRPGPEKTVKAFVEHLNNRNIDEMSEMMTSTTMTSIAERDKNTKITYSGTQDFLKLLERMPADREFHEEIEEYRTSSDGVVGTVVTPYTFYLDGKKSHRGTNVFTLAYLNDQWQIIAITDSQIITKK